MPTTPVYAVKILNLMRGGASIAAWTPWIAIFMGDPMQGGAEFADPAYGRQPLTISDPTLTPEGQSANTVEVVFPLLAVDMTAPMKYYGILTAQTGGELRYYDVIPGTDAGRTLAAGQEISIRVGGLVIVEAVPFLVDDEL